MQNTFVNYGIVKKIAPLLARKNSQLGMEVMALFDVMLFNANKNVQVNIGFYVIVLEKAYKYCWMRLNQKSQIIIYTME